MAKEVKIVWFRGYQRLYQSSISSTPVYGDEDDTYATEVNLAELLNDGWQIEAAGGGGDNPKYFVILVRDQA